MESGDGIDEFLMHTTDNVLPFDRFFAKFALLQVIANLHTSLNMGIDVLEYLFNIVRKIIELG